MRPEPEIKQRMRWILRALRVLEVESNHPVRQHLTGEYMALLWVLEE